jgi:DNA-binding NtrC family response regulator
MTTAQPGLRPATLPVLPIEDEPPVMACVQPARERSGYAVASTESRAEGLRRLGAETFLGVVSDLRPPGRSDLGRVHAGLSRHRPHLASRIVFIAGDIANEDTVATWRKTGAACLERPFRIQPYISVMQKTIGKAA